MIKLAGTQMSELLSHPETGMGYQTVEIKFASFIRKATVYNAELLLLEDEPRINLTEDVFQYMVKSASSLQARLIESIRVVRPARPTRPLTAMKKFAADLRGKPATEGAEKKTEDGDVFIRFTAYMNDRRITPEGALRPGTYATTEADSRNVRTGAEAVERYALPDPRPAKYRFQIDPIKDTVYRGGTVQPAYEHKGGGVEVIFDDGTDDGTVTMSPTILPEK